MSELYSLFIAEPYWSFMILGGVLLIIELLGVNGFALWTGMSGFIVGAIAWIAPLPWIALWLLFALVTLFTTYLWWVWLKKHGKDKSKGSYLNQPKNDLIGVKTIVVEEIKFGSGRVKIKDGTWSAACNEDLEVGTPVVVIDVKGLVLTIEKIV